MASPDDLSFESSGNQYERVLAAPASGVISKAKSGSSQKALVSESFDSTTFYGLLVAFVTSFCAALTFLVLWLLKDSAKGGDSELKVGSLVRFHYAATPQASSAFCADVAADTLIIHGLVNALDPVGTVARRATVTVLTIQSVGPTTAPSPAPGRCTRGIFESYDARVRQNATYMEEYYGSNIAQPTYAQLAGKMRREVTELTVVSAIQFQTNNLPPSS